MSQRHYEKAPIVEAVIDIQVEIGEAPSPEQLQSYCAQISNQFPTVAPIQVINMGVSNDGKEGSGWKQQVAEEKVGLRLMSDNRVLQLKKTGFTFSHLPPYTNWEDFSREARILWPQFVDLFKARKITRYAVRFINRITIPGETIELSDYFNLYPAIPKGVPQDVSGLFLQLQMPQTDIGLNTLAVINMGLAEPDQPKCVAVTLDFDVFSLAELDPMADDVWNELDRLRIRKNELFEACINDVTRGLIE